MLDLIQTWHDRNNNPPTRYVIKSYFVMADLSKAIDEVDRVQKPSIAEK